MTTATIAFQEYLRKLGLDQDKDFLQESVRVMSQMVMELEVQAQTGAAKHERTVERKTQRNGYRGRVWETRVGEIPLRIPKLRTGSYFPSLLEPRRRAEQALLAVVQQAYVEGVSTRKVDELLQAMGLTGIDKSTVSRICKSLDDVVVEFRNRPLTGRYPYVWLDATYLKVRQNHRIVSLALVIAIGVNEVGEREVLGFSLGASETEAFWLEFLRSLIGRGLEGVQLVISDAHEGLKAAIAQVLSGASWQRCRVHFTRNLLSHIPRGDQAMVAAALRTIFAQPDQEAAGRQLQAVYEAMVTRWPKAAEVLLDAENDILAYMKFPKEHWKRIYSNNVLERLNKEVKRRTNVVGVFPDESSVIRLVGAILQEQSDEWQIAKRYFSLESMRKLYGPQPLMMAEVMPFTLAPVH
ncbi:MAG TPA: IS256 family transposase [Brevefilum sp.]|jgi:transposase-like protein|nr:IS256 family transposase [Brevefilum sp.]